MLLKYDLNIDKEVVQVNLKRLTNQIYKLLPLREEGHDWQKPLETILEELAGINRLFFDQQPMVYKLACKLEGLFTLIEEDNFMIYRSVIFECLSIIGDLLKCL